MNNYRNNIGFLFDLDGVIIDSEKEYSRIWAQINREFPTGVVELEKKIKGGTLTKILHDHYDSEETRIAVANRLHELEGRMLYEYLPHAKDFLIFLKEQKYPRVLVTSSDNEKMRHLWEQLPELKDYFDYIITGDQVKTSKPSPEGYLLGASKISRSPKKCVVFEDSLQGVMAGQNAGCIVVGVAGTLPKEKLAPYSHIIINSFDELDFKDLILKLEQNE